MNLTVTVAETNPSSIVFSMISNNINFLRELSIFYVLLHSSVTNIEMLSVRYHSPTSTGVSFTSSNTLNFEHALTSVDTSTGTIKVFAVLNGFNMTLSTSINNFTDFDIDGVHSNTNSSLI